MAADLNSYANEATYTSRTKNGGSLKKKILYVFSNITVEPIVSLYFVSSVLLMLSVANLNLEKACRVKLKFNETVCDGLADRNSSLYTEEDEIRVQKTVATMNAWKNVVQSALPSCLLLFFGAWSDQHNRRKPFMIFPICGEITTVIGLICCTYFFYELPMEVTGVMESVPIALTGGWFSMNLAIYSYITTICSEETRTFRIGLVNVCNTGSVMIGIGLSGILYKSIGLYGVFSLALTLYVTALLLTIFKIKESEPIKENINNEEYTNKKNKGGLKNLINCQYIVETLKVAFKRRQKNWRTRICLIMVLVMLIMGPLHGEINVVYLFTRKQFQWDEMQFSLFYTYFMCLHIIGTIFSLSFFSKFLKLDDAILGMISSSSKILSGFVYAFAPNSTIFYIGVIVEILNGTSFIALRSIISNLVPLNELGKINALFGVCEASMPLIYGPMYNLVYRNTIDVLPGAFYLVGGILTLPVLVILMWLYFQHKNDLKDKNINQPQQEELLNIPAR